MADDVYVELSVGELAALADTSSLVLDAVEPDMTPDQAEAAAVDGRRSAVERGLATDLNGELTPVEPVAQVLDVVSRPGLVARARRRGSDRDASAQYFAIPRLSVIHERQADGQHRFTPFPTADILVEIMEVTGLMSRPAPSVEPFELDTAALSGRWLDEPDATADSISAELERGGAPTSAAATFAEALRARHFWATVALLHRPAEHVYEGGDLSWIDCGDHGLWIIEGDRLGSLSAGATVSDHAARDEAVAERLTVTPASAEQIAAALLAYLPG